MFEMIITIISSTYTSVCVCVQVFCLDFATSGASPTVRGSVAVPERFHRLTWSVKPSEQSNLPVSRDTWRSVRAWSLLQLQPVGL